MNKELMEALNILEKEKEISKETLFEAIENSLLTACKNHFGKVLRVEIKSTVSAIRLNGRTHHSAHGFTVSVTFSIRFKLDNGIVVNKA